MPPAITIPNICNINLTVLSVYWFSLSLLNWTDAFAECNNLSYSIFLFTSCFFNVSKVLILENNTLSFSLIALFKVSRKPCAESLFLFIML